MIITKPTQSAAQELADRCHAYLISTDEAYKQSVLSGHTLQWAIPQETDQGWAVPVSERVYPCLTALEYTPPVSPG